MKIKLFILSILIICQQSFAGKPQNKEIIGSGIIGVNHTREYAVESNTLIYKDDELIDYQTFEIIGSGYKTTFVVKAGTKEIIGSGIVDTLILETNLRGPITSLSPLAVLEQPVLRTSDTETSLFESENISDIVSVSGYLSINNSIKASKLVSASISDDWKIRGYISSNNIQNFHIGNLKINHANELLINCDNGINKDDYVQVLMSKDENYTIGSAINTVNSVECFKSNQLPVSQTDSLATILQGFISQKTGNAFWFNDVKVITQNNTLYENGEKRFLDEMVNVEVEGVFNPISSELLADKIRFIDSRIEIEFPLNPNDITLGQSVTINNVDYLKTPQTKDLMNAIENGMTTSKQVNIEGYIDSNGIAYIAKLSHKGNVNYDKVNLRGRIYSVVNPTFKLLNFTVDSSNSLIINQGGGVIDNQTFYSIIGDGYQVEVKNGQFDFSTNTVQNAKIIISGSSTKRQNQTKEIIGSGVVKEFVTATLTSTHDGVFLSGFD